MKESVKKHKKKNEIIKKNQEIDVFSNNFENKIYFYENLIQETILSIQRYKYLDIITANELNISTQNLEGILNELTEIKELTNKNIIADKLQHINNTIHDVLKQYGTDSIHNLLTVAFGKEFINSIESNDKFKIINNRCS